MWNTQKNRIRKEPKFGLLLLIISSLLLPLNRTCPPSPSLQLSFPQRHVLSRGAEGEEGAGGGAHESMSDSFIARLAHEVSEKVMAEDPITMAGDKLNGKGHGFGERGVKAVGERKG